ncbi:hypothetical protein MTBBW1_2710005 [Desulfamplus magnetovallimortis]|uniref:Zinc ribbon domain-containing protein n=1 Tax=Desulfamplus magnetovallimortis TaxID=1246637 RepID=A0A1W1HFE0_9BACT|nr:hypothetical protein [Desulfamplus magnetovallimortis]SLM31118.1 hypothetical protein MTBBW1_2710005 [Desulfamplus magnetovallimortis]
MDNMSCPKCGADRAPSTQTECPYCGIIYSKFKEPKEKSTVRSQNGDNEPSLSLKSKLFVFVITITALFLFFYPWYSYLNEMRLEVIGEKVTSTVSMVRDVQVGRSSKTYAFYFLCYQTLPGDREQICHEKFKKKR